MKHRKGFVSNSSTSSFMIYGAKFDGYDSDTIALKLYKALHPEEEVDKETFDYELDDILYKFDNDFDVYINSDYGSYIGVSLNMMLGEETKNQFIQRIKNLLNEKLRLDVLNEDELPKFGWYQESWYDG